jgi:hypothetical protein
MWTQTWIPRPGPWSIEATLEGYSGLSHNLPVHMRCAAHTFNLVASVDVDKVLDSAQFKSAYRKAMSKARALWNQQCHSTVWQTAFRTS